MTSYPPIPTNATLFWTGYGYEEVTKIIKWQWSTTFGCWGAVVTFAEGCPVYTYPRRWTEDLEEDECQESPT